MFVFNGVGGKIFYGGWIAFLRNPDSWDILEKGGGWQIGNGWFPPSPKGSNVFEAGYCIHIYIRF